jgi:hypothetical protein
MAISRTATTAIMINFGFTKFRFIWYSSALERLRTSVHGALLDAVFDI